MRMRCVVLASCVLAACSAASAAGGTSERILSYHSDVVVHEDGWLTVTETINVRSARKQIKRGIYRDFPTVYPGKFLTREVRPFKVLRVLRDGKREAYHIEDKGDYVRLYVGRKTVVLSPGVYIYTLVYRTGRQMRFFDDHDELYWNVTGNFWNFPIDKVTASVTLPRGVPPREVGHEAYTGKAGAKGRDFRSSLAAGEVRFIATRSLQATEGLTIVVTFPKGFVKEPPRGERFSMLIRDNQHVVVGLAGLLVVFVYYLVLWTKVGRDPAAGTIIPLFEPPDGLSPAAVRFIRRMGFDKNCFTVAVVDMAVKGFTRIDDHDGDYTLVRLKEDENGELSEDEKQARKKLVGGSISVEQKNHSKFQAAIKAQKKSLSSAYEKKLFISNLKFAIIGAAISAFFVLLATLSGRGEARLALTFIVVWLAFWSFGVYALVQAVIASWRSAKGKAAFTTLFAIPFVAGEIVALGFLAHQGGVLMLMVVVGMLLLNGVFFRLLKAPTVRGRKVMDRIDGFGMYLGTAEQDRLNFATPREKTPELFEEYLPYAMALDVANEWAEQFSEVLGSAAAAEGRGGYTPSWYHGAAYASLAGGFASSFGSSFSGALSSASTSPSSSGSGGGGSSGGGGGGGGGGW